MAKKKKNRKIEKIIRERAHELFISRGEEYGYDLDDWLQAEKDITDKKKQKKVEKREEKEAKKKLKKEKKIEKKTLKTVPEKEERPLKAVQKTKTTVKKPQSVTTKAKK